MLLELSIKNYALIPSLQLKFSSGFIVFTGETGAGKSIIIGALSLLLGERASAGHIRKGKKSAVIQGIFSIPETRELLQFLEKIDIEIDEGTLIIRRSISKSGRSRAFVNGVMVTLNVLQTIGGFLVDLHGQHAHQSLFRIDEHLNILDRFAGIDIRSASAFYQKFIRNARQLKDRKRRQREIQEKLELSQFQLSEIELIDPQPGELDAAEAELKLLENSEKLLAFAHQAGRVIKEDDASLIDRLNLLIRECEPLTEADGRLSAILERLTAAWIDLDDLDNELNRYASNVEYEPARIQVIRKRLDDLNLLCRKYGNSLDDVLKKRDLLRAQLEEIESGDYELGLLEKNLERMQHQLSDIFNKLSLKRRVAAKKLDQEVEQQLADLGMENTRFKTDVRQKLDKKGAVQLNGSTYRAMEKGIDLAEFRIAPNVGEDPKPLAKIASGGELSRVMLSIKTVLSDVDAVPTLIFDEADAGIGGSIAEKLGQKMRSLGQKHQVICITHLPIIATMGDEHFVIHKEEHEGRTVTHAVALNERERKREIARMLGGNETSPIIQTHARELLRKNRSPKRQLKLL
ncbi:MAG: DNA repair protein RecN [Candidatus Cloacimonetes bacterium 4572_55]|nr:MAG: DNA repair protein RecN [Candidatus Cloacimonetes bacterium 4572_55]